MTKVFYKWVVKKTFADQALASVLQVKYKDAEFWLSSFKHCLYIFEKQHKFSIEHECGTLFNVSKQKFLHILFRSTLLDLVMVNSSNLFSHLPI